MANTIEIYAELAKRLKYPDSNYLIKILEKIVTPEEGRLLLEMPAATSELAKKLNRSEKDIEKNIEDLWHRGLLWVTAGQRALPDEVWKLQDTVTAYERMDPEVGTLFKEWYKASWCKDLSKQFIRPVPLLRLTPTHKSLDGFRKTSKETVLPAEDPRQMVEKVDLLALRHLCACRYFMKDCENSLKVCLQFNESAEMDISRKMARKVSVDEAMNVLDLAEKQGLVQLVANKGNISQIRSICNCCSCCCVVINPAIKHGTLSQVLAKTRYESSIDETACTACQKCIERCPFEAIEMVKPEGSKKYKAHVNPEKCWGCGVCYTACKREAISLKVVRPVSHIPV